MKTIKLCVLFIIITSFSPYKAAAYDWETYEMVNKLLTIRVPGVPVIHEDHVIFTAASDLRRVGVAFAHEGFFPVYWFTQLIVPKNITEMILLPGQKVPDPYKDSGLQFHVYKLPDHLRELEYRLVINGLWTIDPVNPVFKRDPVSGLSLSVLSLPQRPANYNPLNGLPEGLKFSFRGSPGETVTVAGNFNNWDPFMYELKEYPAGIYSITIPLPPGTYQYVFFHRGERFTDPFNSRRAFSRDGKAVSEIIIPK
ncbi:MAG: glycogen-binding domain-containing protein [Treponema sp.]|nr:glycogen-binding domain-containing protein [Treponema sp.]